MFKNKLQPHLMNTLARIGYENPTPVQKMTIPKIKSGVDLVCIAPANSGKSVSIVISVIQRLNAALDDVPRAIIVVADFEQGQIMAEQFRILGEETDLRVFVGKPGVDMQKQKETIYFGMDVVIGTAKILNDLCSLNAINMNGLKMFIIDDADVVIKPENVVRLDRLAACIPKSQCLIFSKTQTDKTMRFAERYMNNAQTIVVE